MTNYFDNLNEKMADWFLQFFSDDEYIVQTVTAHSDTVFTTVDKELTEDIFAAAGIDMTFLNDLYLKVAQLALIAGNALISAFNNTVSAFKAKAPEMTVVNSKVAGLQDKVTTVFNSVTDVAAEEREKAITAAVSSTRFMLMKANGISKKLKNSLTVTLSMFEHRITMPFLRTIFLEGHST